MWLYIETEQVDLKINKALNKAKQAIMGNNNRLMRKKEYINVSGQMAIRADIESETTFIKTLELEGLSGVLFSEESGEKHFGKGVDAEDAIVLLLDPLDGSQNYMKGLPIGCISVAYGKYVENATLATLSRAAILNLYSDDLFFAVEGVGAWFNGEPIQMNKGDQILDNELSQISFYAYGEVAKRYFFDFQEKHSLRSLGSAAWELALTVIGINDAYIDLRGVLRAHDFMASKIIIESVGGSFKFVDESVDISTIKLDTFKEGYAVVSSYHPGFVDYLINDFKKHGLV
ncbi:MAG: hypothetical protein INQ03_19240 [Candidatus Heimdallarchaeota archaeon]|nr:hypothetical protein [Candidatus Heimdallarchaeota archaeon]